MFSAIAVSTRARCRRRWFSRHCCLQTPRRRRPRSSPAWSRTVRRNGRNTSRTEFGWFKQDKIELDLVTVGGGGAQQVAGGSLNIAHSGYPDFARAALQGAPVKIIISDIIGSPYAIFAKPTIKQIADLKGKLISIGGVNDITLIYIKPFLASAGLKTSDVDFVYAKAAGDRFSALVSGGVDATHAQPADLFQGDRAGLYQSRRYRSRHAKEFRSRCGRANTDWAAKNRDGADRLRAQLQARGVSGSTIPPTSSRRSTSWSSTPSRTRKDFRTGL